MHLSVQLGEQALDKVFPDENAEYSLTTLKVIRHNGLTTLEDDYGNVTFQDGYVFSLTNTIRLFLLRLWSVILDMRRVLPPFSLRQLRDMDASIHPAVFTTEITSHRDR